MYQYPYGDYQQLNLDWILNKIKELENNASANLLTEFANALIALSFDSSKVYKYGEIVFNPNDRKLYIMNSYSYPSGGSAWDPSYWDECLIGDVLYSIIRKNYATLLSTNDNTDRTTDIINQLNAYGICVLGSGYFYTSGLLMPDGSTIKGVSSDSVIRLIDGNNKTAITVGSECTVENVQIIGADSSITTSATIGSRHGIEWNDNLNVNSTVQNCRIKHFAGAGIYLHDTGTLTYKGLMISDCYVDNNNCGIYIQKNSEFNKITNCIVTRNYYGILNRGGNNIVANCGFDANHINAQVDNDEGSNGGHGSFVGCTFNHAEGNGTGDSITIKGTGRMLLAACNFYYGNINLISTDGNVFSGCGFGNTTPINLNNNGCDMFVGCMFKSESETPVTITGTSDTQFIECFFRDGTPFRNNLVEYLFMGGDTNKIKKINDGTNYDTLTSVGSYYCENGTSAQTMTNAPQVKTGHNLYVFNFPAYSESVVQLAVLTYKTCGLMVRSRQSISGGFSDWHYLFPVAISDTLAAGTSPQTFSHNTIGASSRILDVSFETPENVGSDVTITPSDGGITISGTFYGSTKITYYVI